MASRTHGRRFRSSVVPGTAQGRCGETAADRAVRCRRLVHPFGTQREGSVFRGPGCRPNWKEVCSASRGALAVPVNGSYRSTQRVSHSRSARQNRRRPFTAASSRTPQLTAHLAAVSRQHLAAVSRQEAPAIKGSSASSGASRGRWGTQTGCESRIAGGGSSYVEGSAGGRSPPVAEFPSSHWTDQGEALPEGR